MATTPTPIFPQVIQNWGFQLVNGSGTTKQTLLTAGTNGSMVDCINVSNTDTNPYDVALYLNDGSTSYLLTTVSVPANSGFTNSAPAIDLLRSSQIPSMQYDMAGNRVLPVKGTFILQVAVLTTITSGKFVNVVATGGDF